MKYARIELAKTNYSSIIEMKFIVNPNVSMIGSLQAIYEKYCRYKQFDSVMPIFDSEFTDPKNDVFGYYIGHKLVAFSLYRIYDQDNIEAVQFAWDYQEPDLRLGIRSLEAECSYYKNQQYKYLYLGGADEYKQQIDGFEILPGVK